MLTVIQARSPAFAQHSYRERKSAVAAVIAVAAGRRGRVWHTRSATSLAHLGTAKIQVGLEVKTSVVAAVAMSLSACLTCHLYLCMGRQEERQAPAGRAGLPVSPEEGETWQWARGSGREGCVAGNVDYSTRSLQVWGGGGGVACLVNPAASPI